MAARCVVLKNHKNRGADFRLKHSMSPHFVKLRCTNWQVALGIHHQFAIDHVKFTIEEDGDDPNDFDYLSFDYLEGHFIDHLFTSARAVEIWKMTNLIDIRYLGPYTEDEDPEDNIDADQFPEASIEKPRE